MESYNPAEPSSHERANDRKAADWGFFWIVIGTVVWAVGDLPFEQLLK